VQKSLTAIDRSLADAVVAELGRSTVQDILSA
jgi:hypothetical protein